MSLPIFQIKRRNKNTNEEYSTNQKLNGLIDGELGYNYYDNSLWIGPYNETTGENYAILVNENHQINNSKWTNGTTSGPQLALHQYDSRSQSGGWFNVNSIPTATDSQSGVITTGAQNFAGVKTFKNGLTVTNSAGTSNIAKIDTNGYIEGTLLKTTGATELNSTSKVAVIKDGWIHYITPSNLIAGITKFTGVLNGNATTATKLETARTISLTGDVTGSTTFDGSDNTSITATVADNSHNHIISNVDGLQTALDSKFTIYGHTGGIDLNTLKTNGSYYISDGATNVPYPYAELLVMHNGDTTGQLTIPYNEDQSMCYRGASNNGGFYAWKTLLDSSGGTVKGTLSFTGATPISIGGNVGFTMDTHGNFINGNSSTDSYWVIFNHDKTKEAFKVYWETGNAGFTGNVTAPTFIGALTGNASNATTFGDDSLKVYVTAGNEINFGGTYNSSSIFFGYRAKDSKPIPSRFYFGGTYGTGTVVAKTFEGTATNATKATTATKATQDENGNNIVSTYQKQADAVGKKCTYRNPTGAEIFNNYSNIAEANYSTAMGSGTWAWQLGECVVGLYNQHKTYTNDNEQFVIGNGYVANGEEIRGNALVVTNKGHGYFKGFSTSSGADYAEYFEWEDSNINHDDRRGYFVTLNKNKIKIAKSNDYILGVVSGNPSVIGNGDIDWQGRYLKDEFDSIIQTKIECEEQIIDEEGKIQTITRTMLKDKENPEYDAKRPYVSRSDRPEWDAIGMIGVLAVRDDGTCQVNSYCKVTDEGIATASDTGYRVITRVNDRVIKIILK